MKTIIAMLLMLLTVSCSNCNNEQENNLSSLERLKVMQSNISKQEYDYKISSVEEGIKSWKSDIKFEYTESNNHDFLIYFTNQDCSILPYDYLQSYCLLAIQKTNVGFMYPTFNDDKTLKTGIIVLFNEFFNVDTDFRYLSQVVAHEIGHIYGLRHDNTNMNVMNPYFEGQTEPNEEYVNIMNYAVKNKSIPIGYENKFYSHHHPPKVDITFYIQILSAKTK